MWTIVVEKGCIMVCLGIMEEKMETTILHRVIYRVYLMSGQYGVVL